MITARLSQWGLSPVVMAAPARAVSQDANQRLCLTRVANHVATADRAEGHAVGLAQDIVMSVGNILPD